MNYSNIVYTLCYTVLVLMPQIEPLSIMYPSSVKRELRFTKFELRFPNKSSATILENEIRQYQYQQGIFLHFIMHDKITELNIKISVSSCKDQYIDCVNIISYDICDVCSKISAFTYLADTNNRVLNKCPITGDYYFKNMSINSDKFGSLISIPSENWWQKYWRIEGACTTFNKVLHSHFRLEFYAVQFRSRT